MWEYDGPNGRKLTLPVGTIMVGSGLTEQQKKRVPVAERLYAIADLLEKSDGAWLWRDTAEGYLFWQSIEKRLREMARAACAERRKPTVEFKLGDVLRLKSGGPNMTVAFVGADGVMHCRWYSANGTMNSAHFVPEMVEKV